MYRYSDAERQQLTIRAEQFDQQIERFQQGQIHPDIFSQLRLRNGLYEQRHAPMLRVAIPYGELGSNQLRALADVADQFDKGYGHLTTRQNIQFNWPKMVDVPAMLKALAAEDMHAIQTSGSCIRNISTDHLAGVAVDEIEDPRPWCEMLRQWSTLHPEFNWLPRKFKFAVTGSVEDRALIRLHDIGLQLIHDDKRLLLEKRLQAKYQNVRYYPTCSLFCAYTICMVVEIINTSLELKFLLTISE